MFLTDTDLYAGASSSNPTANFGHVPAPQLQSSTSSNSMSASMGAATPSAQQPSIDLDPTLHHVTVVQELAHNEGSLMEELDEILDGTQEIPDDVNRPETDDEYTFGVGTTVDDDDDDDDDDANDTPSEGPTINVTDPSTMQYDFHSYGSFQDMGSGEPIEEDTSSFRLNRWSERNNDLRIGMIFQDKNEVIYAVRQWSLRRAREYKVIKSKPNMYTAQCRNSTDANSCYWYIRVILKSTHRQWQITQYNGEHTCMPRVVSNNHVNLSGKHIARQITHLVREDPEIPVKSLIAEVKKLFDLGCSYGKGWNARRFAIEMVYGDWKTSFQVLPTYLQALNDTNSGTIIRWRHHSESTPDVKMFKEVFWAFQPSIRGFQYCRPVISVDGTFLRGSYRGVLLVASTWDANNHVFPLAFAVVGEESLSTWGWFLTLLRNHVVLQREVCLISDRHKGILGSIERYREWQPPYAVHRYCLRHIKANFNAKFRNRDLTQAMYKAGSECKKEKFAAIMEEIRLRNPVAYDYLNSIDREKWTLAYDDGHRYGCLTTNLSESLNSVIKKARALPIKAMVELIFAKIVKYFAEHREQGAHSRHPFPPRIWKTFSNAERKSMAYTVTPYNISLGLYSVKTPFRGDGRGNNVYTVKLSEKWCSCNKWSAFGIPCSHAVAVARERGLNAVDLMNAIYSITCYRNTYQENFFPVANECFWRPPPFNLIHNPLNMKAQQSGRLRTTRIRCDMDYRNPDEPRRCGNCHGIGHNRRNCPGREMGGQM